MNISHARKLGKSLKLLCLTTSLFSPATIYNLLFWGLWLYVVVLVLFRYKSAILMQLTVHSIAY